MHKKGFTLLELLVVVLIIGILASVALPQYRKAVMKSRFTQWVMFINTLDKAEEMWVMANGYPASGGIYFTGANPGAELDIDMTCDSVSGNYCYTEMGRFVAACKYTTECYIDFGTNYTGYAGPLPANSSIWTSRYNDGQFNNKRALLKVPSDKTFRKIVCQWWATHYGKEQMKEEVITDCSAVGI